MKNWLDPYCMPDLDILRQFWTLWNTLGHVLREPRDREGHVIACCSMQESRAAGVTWSCGFGFGHFETILDILKQFRGRCWLAFWMFRTTGIGFYTFIMRKCAEFTRICDNMRNLLKCAIMCGNYDNVRYCAEIAKMCGIALTALNHCLWWESLNW